MYCNLFIGELGVLSQPSATIYARSESIINWNEQRGSFAIISDGMQISASAQSRGHDGQPSFEHVVDRTVVSVGSARLNRLVLRNTARPTHSSLIGGCDSVIMSLWALSTLRRLIFWFAWMIPWGGADDQRLSIEIDTIEAANSAVGWFEPRGSTPFIAIQSTHSNWCVCVCVCVCVKRRFRAIVWEWIFEAEAIRRSISSGWSAFITGAGLAGFECGVQRIDSVG